VHRGEFKQTNQTGKKFGCFQQSQGSKKKVGEVIVQMMCAKIAFVDVLRTLLINYYYLPNNNTDYLLRLQASIEK
jgi:hypothetical protein